MHFALYTTNTIALQLKLQVEPKVKSEGNCWLTSAYCRIANWLKNWDYCANWQMQIAVVHIRIRTAQHWTFIVTIKLTKLYSLTVTFEQTGSANETESHAKEAVRTNGAINQLWIFLLPKPAWPVPRLVVALLKYHSPNSLLCDLDRVLNGAESKRNGQQFASESFCGPLSCL